MVAAYTCIVACSLSNPTDGCTISLVTNSYLFCALVSINVGNG